MDSASTSSMVQPAIPRRRRWWKGTKFVLGIVALLILGPIGIWWWSHHNMASAWDEAVKEAELDLPRWRLMELEEDRPKIPDAENSALHMIAVRKKGGAIHVGDVPNYEEIFKKLPPTARLNQQQEDLIRKELAKIAKPLEEARKVKDMPRGRFPVTFTD